MFELWGKKKKWPWDQHGQPMKPGMKTNYSQDTLNIQEELPSVALLPSDIHSSGS